MFLLSCKLLKQVHCTEELKHWITEPQVTQSQIFTACTLNVEMKNKENYKLLIGYCLYLSVREKRLPV